MKTSELKGAELDYWVARAEEIEGLDIENQACWILHKSGIYLYHPSIDWEQGGPLIEKYGISLIKVLGKKTWRAEIKINKKEDKNLKIIQKYNDLYLYTEYAAIGNFPLQAAMRCIVKSKFGDEVEDL